MPISIDDASAILFTPHPTKDWDAHKKPGFRTLTIRPYSPALESALSQVASLYQMAIPCQVEGNTLSISISMLDFEAFRDARCQYASSLTILPDELTTIEEVVQERTDSPKQHLLETGQAAHVENGSGGDPATKTQQVVIPTLRP